MPRVDREYDTIIKGLKAAQQALSDLKACAKMLNTEADAASAELKDRVGQKDTGALKDLASAILNAVKPGEEQVRELERTMQKQKDDFERL